MDQCPCSFCQKGDTDYCLKKIDDTTDDMLNNRNTNAITYYEKAHDEGDPLASVCLGKIYDYLYIMLDKDIYLEKLDNSICYEKALYWYKKFYWYKISLDNDTINIAARIAKLYHTKYETDKNVNDLQLCINWYEHAILKETKDVGEHMFDFGMLYIKTIKPPNYNLAIEYFVKAVDKGHWRAAAKLSCMYFRGIGVKRDYKTSDEWKDKADGIINDTYSDVGSLEYFQQKLFNIATSERV